jgi:uncharacterized protein (DUF58 family)
LGAYLPLLVLLIITAAVGRDDFALTLIYLFLGAFFIGNWWSSRALRQVTFKRSFPQRAFLGEDIPIHLKISNRSWLPVLWLNLQDALPVALRFSSSFQQVTSLGAHAETQFTYRLEARKRGYYQIGPLFIASGDILGLGSPLNEQIPPEYLTVYPKIIPLTSLSLPSRSPHGTLRHSQPLFEDPTRVFSKREYVAGDSLRRVDWKATATTGRMQVKLFEPSISLETLLFVNLNAEDYYFRNRLDSTELAIVIAASVANWIAGKGQTVGLKVNGTDPLAADGLPQYIPPRKGQAHLIRILETLARVELTHDTALATLIQQQRYALAWGTTLIVITGEADDDLLHELYQARRAGQNTVLILAGPVPYTQEIRFRAEHFGIPVAAIATEREMDIWRK